MNTIQALSTDIPVSTAIEELLELNGIATIPPCTYQFPYEDPVGFADTANQVTTVGIGAYMGAIKVSICSQRTSCMCDVPS